MFHRIQEYEFISAGGRVLRPRFYGDPQADGSWAGWIVFFPVSGGVEIAPPSPEAIEQDLPTLEAWAAALTPVDLEGALDRALRVAEEPPLLADLVETEYQALDDAARLEFGAELERTAADMDENAAQIARAEVGEIRRDCLHAERALGAPDEQAATADAKRHEEPPRHTRAAGSEAQHRRRSAHKTRRRRGGSKKK